MWYLRVCLAGDAWVALCGVPIEFVSWLGMCVSGLEVLDCVDCAAL